MNVADRQQNTRIGPSDKLILPPSANLVFHYTTVNTAIAHILFEKRLRMSPICRLDDPRERLDLSFLSIGKQEIDQRVFTIQKKINEVIKRKCKVCCFSQDNMKVLKMDPRDTFERGYSRSRMWSQYAERHAGICLVFSKREFSQAIDSQEKGILQVWKGPVQYRNRSYEFTNAKTIDISNLEQQDDLNVAMTHVGHHYNAFFFEKAEDYQDEREYRWVVMENNDDYSYVNIESSLRAIILGVAFPNGFLGAVEKYLHDYSIEGYRLTWHNGRPRLSENM